MEVLHIAWIALGYCYIAVSKIKKDTNPWEDLINVIVFTLGATLVTGTALVVLSA